MATNHSTLLPNPDRDVTYRDVDRAGDQLNAEQATILRLRLGRPGAPPLSLEETGELLGCTREEVRRHESAGMATLRTLPGSAAGERATKTQHP